MLHGSEACFFQINRLLLHSESPPLAPATLLMAIELHRNRLEEITDICEDLADRGVNPIRLSSDGTQSEERVMAEPEPHCPSRPELDPDPTSAYWSTVSEECFLIPSSSESCKQHSNLVAARMILAEVHKGAAVAKKKAPKELSYEEDLKQRICKALVVLTSRRLLAQHFTSVRFAESLQIGQCLELADVVYNVPSFEAMAKGMVVSIYDRIKSANCSDRASLYSDLIHNSCQLIEDVLPIIIHKRIPDLFKEKEVNMARERKPVDFITVEVETGGDSVLATDVSVGSQLPIGACLSVTSEKGYSVKLSFSEEKGWVPDQVRLVGSKVTLQCLRFPPAVHLYSLKFTGHVFGRFEIGYEALRVLLEDAEMQTTRCVPAAPLRHLWVRCIYLACKLTGVRRLKLVQLLQRLLRICKQQGYQNCSIGADLHLLAPLWALSQTLWKHEQVEKGNPWELGRLLGELFYEAENLALIQKRGQEYAEELLTCDQKKRFIRALGRGFHAVGCIGIAIGIPNRATEVCSQIMKHVREKNMGSTQLGEDGDGTNHAQLRHMIVLNAIGVSENEEAAAMGPNDTETESSTAPSSNPRDFYSTPPGNTSDSEEESSSSGDEFYDSEFEFH